MRALLLTSLHPCFDVRIYQKEARSLASAGVDVILVGIGKTKRMVTGGITVIGIPSAPFRILRFINWYRILFLAFKCRADVYHIHDPELLPVAILLKIATKAAVIYDVHENVPEDILSKDWIPKLFRSLLSRAFLIFENAVARLMSGVVVVNELLEQRFKAKSNTVRVSNYTRLEDFDMVHAQGSEIESDWRYFIYAGIVSIQRGLIQYADAITKLNIEKTCVLCAGMLKRDNENDVRKKLLESNPSRIRYLGLLPYHKIPGLYKNATAGLLCYQPTPNNVLGTPNKLFEYMCAGIPVIASNFPLIREIVEPSQCGILVDPLNINEIADAMSYLIQHPAEAKLMGANGQQAVKEKYNWNLEEKKLLLFYESLTRNFHER